MNEYLEQLRSALTRNAAVAPPIISTAKEDYEKPLEVEPAPNISGDITRELNFDGNGDAYIVVSQSAMGITINLSGRIAGLDARFDIWLDTNYSEHRDWHNIGQDQFISTTLRTNFWSKTQIKVKVHSSRPNNKAIAKLHYST